MKNLPEINVFIIYSLSMSIILLGMGTVLLSLIKNQKHEKTTNKYRKTNPN
jgi:hypothetical protein